MPLDLVPQCLQHPTLCALLAAVCVLVQWYDVMRAPLGRLYFAGEAMCKRMPGYLQGAYASGVHGTAALAAQAA
jgi:monoamine oxidase